MKIELTILGLLMEDNLYGYEIKKKIVERLEEFVDIKFGSIYYAIKKAVENKWVEKIGTEKDGGNPERYIYKILPNGRKYYKKALKQYFDHTMVHFDVDIVLMFYNTLPLDQKEQFINDRLAFINGRIEYLGQKISDAENTGAGQSHLDRYILSHLRAELDWLLSLEKVHDGESSKDIMMIS